MKLAIAALAALTVGCQLSPVITTPEEPREDLYHACRRASRDYCKDALDKPPSEIDKCVAEATYACLSGLPR